jgi:2-polyprenyl-6-hydroxyphenyl methylase/3-demethylubiquinone-9 3-methyltransferase
MPGPPRARNDLALYDRAADEWWDPDAASFRSLHAVKVFHLAVLRRRYGAALATGRIVDLGCGGGLLSIPLAADGAEVTGVDLSAPSLAAARREAARRGLRCGFVEADLRATPLPDGAADFVLLSDVLEHIEDPGAALREAGRLLRDGGHLFVNTINRTRRASLLAVRIAEGLGYVPRGTHDPRLFVRPDELRDLARAAGLRIEALVGESPRLAATIRHRAIQLRRSRGLGVLYSAFLVRQYR